MTVLLRILFFLFLLSVPGILPAQLIDFDRDLETGKSRTARIRMKLSREYLFLIPGAGEQIKTSETMDFVLLSRFTIRKLNEKGVPEILEIIPQVAGGTLNGRAIVPEELTGKTIIADLSVYPCRFQTADGSKLSRNAQMVIASVFRVQYGAKFSDILGKPRQYKPNERWVPEINPILNILHERDLRKSVTAQNFQAAAKFGNQFPVNGIKCTAVDLSFRTVGTHSYDFRSTARIILPVNKQDGGMLSLQREGVEVVDQKIISDAPAAAGTSVRLITTEQLEVVFVPEKKENPPGEKSFFEKMFR
jgi:hypothetical protein